MRPEVVELDRISDYPHYWAARHPGREAMVMGPTRLSYADLATEVDRCARALYAAGVRRGDRVAMLVTPRPEAMICFLASARLGALWTGLNTRFHFEELQMMVADCQPRILLAMSEFESRSYRDEVRRLASSNPSIEMVMTLQESLPGVSRDYADFLSSAETTTDGELEDAAASVRPEDPALLVYTSGSSGQPKGALITHRALCHCERNQTDIWWADPLRILVNLPMSNMFGVGDTSCYALVAGGTVVFMEKFDPRGTLATIERERVTIWGQVATMFQLALAEPDFASFDLSSLQLVFWAGGPAPRSLFEKLRALCPNVSTNYGLTETVTGITYTQVGASVDVMTETVGQPHPAYELRVVDDSGKALDNDEDGEIVVRGLCQASGYWKRPDATAALIDAEGWLHTGDIGRRCGDGNYRIVGRKSEAFKSGGFKVYPREIEVLLETHPAVALAAVVAVPDALYGEVGWAYLIREPRADIDETAVEAWARERLANFKVPKRFFVRERLPMLLVGKVDRNALKREARGGGEMSTVLSETRNGICSLTLNRPERLNAMTEELVDAFAKALKGANDDESVAVIVVSGAGRAFCAGDDLKEFETQTHTPASTRPYIDRIQDTTRLMMLGEKPVVAAAHGWAVGGGFEWLLNADFVVMGEGTRCFFPEVSLGVGVTGGATALLPRFVGLQQARAMMMFGERYTAEQLRAMGLVYKVVPEAAVQDEAQALARRIASLPHAAVRRLKRLINQALSADFEQVLELESAAVTQGFLDPETAARVAHSPPRRA